MPKESLVIASGELVQKRDIKQKKEDGTILPDKTLFVFKSKPHHLFKENLEHDMHQKFKIIPDKIGFIIGNFDHLSCITEEETQLGSAFFINSQKMGLFEQRNFYQTQVCEVISHIENMLKTEHPSKLVKNDGTQN